MKMVSAAPVDDSKFDFFADLSKPDPTSITNDDTNSSIQKRADSGDDVQARYDALVKSGVTAISSDMLFGEEEKK